MTAHGPSSSTGSGRGERWRQRNAGEEMIARHRGYTAVHRYASLDGSQCSGAPRCATVARDPLLAGLFTPSSSSSHGARPIPMRANELRETNEQDARGHDRLNRGHHRPVTTTSLSRSLGDGPSSSSPFWRTRSAGGKQLVRDVLRAHGSEAQHCHCDVARPAADQSCYFVCDTAANSRVTLPPSCFPPTHDTATGIHYNSADRSVMLFGCCDSLWCVLSWLIFYL